MSYYNQQQPPVGVPPLQGYPPEEYTKDASPRPVALPPPPPLPRQESGGSSLMEGCLAALCCCCLLDACS